MAKVKEKKERERERGQEGSGGGGDMRAIIIISKSIQIKVVPLYSQVWSNKILCPCPFLSTAQEHRHQHKTQVFFCLCHRHGYPCFLSLSRAWIPSVCCLCHWLILTMFCLSLSNANPKAILLSLSQADPHAVLVFIKG